MNRTTVTICAAAMFLPVVVGLSTTAAAVPPSGSAADIVNTLQAQGYNVAFNGATNNMSLARCTVSGVHGLTVMMTTDGSLMMPMASGASGTVYVDLICPDSNN